MPSGLKNADPSSFVRTKTTNKKVLLIETSTGLLFSRNFILPVYNKLLRQHFAI